jgi:GGDEF domain-containing protein
MGQEVKKRLSGEAKADLLELASAVFEMKRCLIEALEAQKTSEITYINEKEIVDSAHEISDTVLIGLLKEEYADGTTAVPRLAGIVRRLIPEGNELTRLLPKIKAALLEAGMPLSEYLDLTRELQSEFHGDELARVLQESSEQAGIDGSELIGEVKTNPVAAAELICLAAEIRKTTGDEKALAELLVDYVERLGPKLALDMTPVNGAAGEKHLRQVITGLESSILNRLRERDVDDHLLERLEQRLAQRMDSILEKFASEWQLTRQGPRQEDNPANLSVLEIMEQSVGEGGELGAILKTIRSKVQSGAIDENDFKQIYAEINNEKREKRPREAKKEPPSRVLKPSVLMHFVEKEVARARRYGVPFSAVALSLVKAKAQGRSASMKLSPQALMDSVSSRLSTVLREADIIGQMGKNKLVIILPMTVEAGAKPTLRRSLKALHAEPIKVNGFSVTITMTGVAIGFDPERKPTVTTFMQALSDELKDMVFRVQYIGELL